MGIWTVLYIIMLYISTSLITCWGKEMVDYYTLACFIALFFSGLIYKKHIETSIMAYWAFINSKMVSLYEYGSGILLQCLLVSWLSNFHCNYERHVSFRRAEFHGISYCGIICCYCFFIEFLELKILTIFLFLFQIHRCFNWSEFLDVYTELKVSFWFYAHFYLKYNFCDCNFCFIH